MNEEKKNERLKKGIVFGLLILVILAVFGGITYAFFTTETDNKTPQDVTYMMGTASMRFADNDDGINATLDFGESITKKFILENTGTADLVAKIYWRDLVNTYLSNSLTYTLSYSENYSETGEGYTDVKTSFDNVPPSTSASKQDLADGIVLAAGKTYYYLLTITLNNLDVDQTEDLKAVFNSKFGIEDGSAGFWDKILMSVKSDSPNFNNLAPRPLTYKDGINVATSTYMSTYATVTNTDYKERYYTYADEYEYNVYTSTYSLVNPKSCQYKSCFEELRGKYAVSPWPGYNSDTLAKYQNLDTIYRIDDSTSLDTLYYTQITREPLSYDYSGDGIYTMEDDYGTSYYYRGAVTNNYVKFGKNKSGQDMFWRIIRINGDGTLRMIYDGTQAWINGEGTGKSVIYTAWANNNDDNKYVGYMYGGADGIASTSLEQAQTNEMNSNTKTRLDGWYEQVFKNTEYEKYLADEIFCNDRSLASNTTGVGYGQSLTEYAFFERLSSNPILTCPQKNDAFTVNDTVKGNGALTYPIGLITADELWLAGMSPNRDPSYSNKAFYLTRNGYDIQTMTPTRYLTNYNATVINKSPRNVFDLQFQVTTGRSIVPVTNIKAEYLDMLKGSGSASNPYYFEIE